MASREAGGSERGPAHPAEEAAAEAAATAPITFPDLIAEAAAEAAEPADAAAAAWRGLHETNSISMPRMSCLRTIAPTMAGEVEGNESWC